MILAPLRGYAIDKTCHLRFRTVKQSNQKTCFRHSLSCCPRLVWYAVAVIAVWVHMIVGNIGEFLHGLVQFFLHPKFVQICTFVLQRVEVPLHRRIVIWISGFAHALDHMSRFAELYENF